MHKVRSEVTGSVWKVEVTVGQAVNEGDTLIVVESMKMEIPIESPAAGTVVDVLVAPQQRIEEGDPVLRIEV